MNVDTNKDYEVLFKERGSQEAHIIIVQDKQSGNDYGGGSFSFKNKDDILVFKNKKNVIRYPSFPRRLREMIEKELAVLVFLEVDEDTIHTGKGNIYFPLYEKSL